MEWDLTSHLVHPEQEEQKVQEIIQHLRDADEAEWSSEDDDDTDAVGPLQSTVHGEELTIDAGLELTDGAERPILLSPQSTVSTPFATLPTKPLFFPLPPPTVRGQPSSTPRQSQSARPATAPSKLATQPQFTFGPLPAQQCATTRATAAAQPASSRAVRHVVAAGSDELRWQCRQRWVV